MSKSLPPKSRSAAPVLRREDVRAFVADFALDTAAHRIIEGSLGLVPGERLVIFVDRARRPLADALAHAARLCNAHVDLLVQEDLGPRPMLALPAQVRTALVAAQASILLTGYQDGEAAMRAELCEVVTEHRLRHGHMLAVQRRSMIEGFLVDPSRIRDVTRAVRVRLRPDSVLRLRSPWGSDVEVRLDPSCQIQERVGVIRPGRLENLPSGEIWSAPSDVTGVYVANGTIGGHLGSAAGSLAAKPVRFEIKNGLCKSVQCIDSALARALEMHLHSEVNGHRVGMFIIGTNVGMTSPTGDMIGDQNLPGLHLAFGKPFPQMTNATWDSRLQLVTMATEADVDLDGAPLLRNGRYAIPTW